MTMEIDVPVGVKVNGINFPSFTDAARHYGLSKQTVSRQAEKFGMSLIYSPGERVGRNSKRWQADTYGVQTDSTVEEEQPPVAVECSICGQVAVGNYQGQPRCSECLSYEYMHDERVAAELNDSEADREDAERDAEQRCEELSAQIDAIVRKLEEHRDRELAARAEQEALLQLRFKAEVVSELPPLSRVVYLLTAEVCLRPEKLTIDTVETLPGSVQVRIVIRTSDFPFIADAAKEPFMVKVLPVSEQESLDPLVQVSWCCRLA